MQEESFRDEADDGEDADDGDYVVIYRSKGRTKIIQDGETIELPPGSTDFGRIQDFIESSVHSSSRSTCSHDAHHSEMHFSTAASAIIEEESVARNERVGSKTSPEKLLADDGELI